MYQRPQQLEFIERYKGLTPAQAKTFIVQDISKAFPQSVLALMATTCLYACNSWEKLEYKIKWLSNYTTWGNQEDYISDLYDVFPAIRSTRDKELALNKKQNKDVGYFTICPHCWRFVFKKYNKIKKNPYCCFHIPGSAAYQRARRALKRPGHSWTSRFLELRGEYATRTQDVIRPHSRNHFIFPDKLEPELYIPVEYDLTQIWPYLTLTREYILKRDGVLNDIGSVISILDPVDRIDPLDMWDENDEEGALVVKEKRLLLHKIIIRDASLFKRNLFLAEAWLKLYEEVRFSKGGPRKNTGGRRPGAGRPRKKT